MIALLLIVALTANTVPAFDKPLDQPALVSQPVRQEAVQPVLNNVTVTLECTAKADGRVQNCHVLAETHPGLGFGEAAIALMHDATVTPGDQDIQFARTIQFTP